MPSSNREKREVRLFQYLEIWLSFAASLVISDSKASLTSSLVNSTFVAGINNGRFQEKENDKKEVHGNGINSSDIRS